MKIVTKYQADDGREFSSERLCLEHERRCGLANDATNAFEAGATLRDAYAIFGREPHQSEAAFAFITKETKLTISHWQCCDRPVYSVQHFDADGRVWVAGNGGWSGWYGAWVWPDDLVRYAEGTPEIAKAMRGAA